MNFEKKNVKYVLSSTKTRFARDDEKAVGRNWFVVCREKISQLNAEIAKLKAGMSPEGSSATLSPAGEVQLMKRFDSLHASTSPSELSLADDVAMDPAVMQAKIKELTSRISEVCSRLCAIHWQGVQKGNRQYFAHNSNKFKHVDIIFGKQRCKWCKTVNRLDSKGNYIATSNNTKLVRWPLMGGSLHLIQRGGAWAGCGPAQSPPRCTKCNSPPINSQCTNHCIAIWWSVALRF